MNKKLNYKILITSFFLIFIIKIIFFFAMVKLNIFTEGDGDYYHNFAIGLETIVYNIWGNILYELNEWELYNREVIKYFLLIFSFLCIPVLVAYNSAKKDKYYIKVKMFWIILILTSLYPMLFLFSLDIYRDIVMVFLFMIAVTFIHISIDLKQLLLKVFFLILFISISYHLIFWRPYLGSALLLTMFIYPIIKINFLTFKVNIILYFFGLSLLFLLGLLDPILTYRGVDGFTNGNNSIGIGLIGKDIIEFNLLFIYSSLLQMFSLHFVNIGAVLLFLLESLPFSLGLYFIIKNRNYLTNFHKFLLLFFVIYGTVWLLGNDNLGTAMRLRIYNYLVVLIIVGSIYIKKQEKRLQKNEK